MRDTYVADIGDFSKYGLLRALCGADLRLGMLWYMNRGTEETTDGGIIQYLFGKPQSLRECDPPLFDALKGLVLSERRRVDEVVRGTILPNNTLHYVAPLPVSERVAATAAVKAEKTRSREQWCLAAESALSLADVVFADPDIGLASASKLPHHKDAANYAFIDELRPYLDRDQSVIFYQHPARVRGITLHNQVSDLMSRLKSELGHGDVWALRWGTALPRTYFVVGSPAHATALWERTQQLVSAPCAWADHFKAHHCFNKGASPLSRPQVLSIPPVSTPSCSTPARAAAGCSGPDDDATAGDWLQGIIRQSVTHERGD